MIAVHRHVAKMAAVTKSSTLLRSYTVLSTLCGRNSLYSCKLIRVVIHRNVSLLQICHFHLKIYPVDAKRLSTTVPAEPENAEYSSEKENLEGTQVVLNNAVCNTPKEAKTNLLGFLNQSDIQKRQNRINIPFFTAGSYLAVTRADPYSVTGITKFVGICIARRNKGLGSTFILRNVMEGQGVEMMFELYSPAIKEIQVLKLERRKRAKLYYLRDKPQRYSKVNEKMQPVQSTELSIYKRKKGAPA